MNETKESLIGYCREGRRVCPLPMHWKVVWEMLPDRVRDGAGWLPAPPLILAAWRDTPALLKMLRLQEHIEWAEQHGTLDQIGKFLRGRSEDQWQHFGD
jgi:hypothetical protein